MSEMINKKKHLPKRGRRRRHGDQRTSSIRVGLGFHWANREERAWATLALPVHQAHVRIGKATHYTSPNAHVPRDPKAQTPFRHLRFDSSSSPSRIRSPSPKTYFEADYG